MMKTIHVICHHTIKTIIQIKVQIVRTLICMMKVILMIFHHTITIITQIIVQIVLNSTPASFIGREVLVFIGRTSSEL